MMNNNEEKILLSEDVDPKDKLYSDMINFYSHMMKYASNPAKRTTSWIDTIHNGYITLRRSDDSAIKYVNKNINKMISEAFKEYIKRNKVDPNIALNMVKSYFPKCDTEINEFKNGAKIREFLIEKTNAPSMYTRAWPTDKELLNQIEEKDWR